MSEIFNNFVKIAQAQGLISDEKPTDERVEAEHTEKDFSETNPRHDSLSIEQIGKLYNTKPAQPKDMEYKKNIMEDAHPDPVVLFMAHDKLNALIENENEGQNARIRITLKEPDGHLTQRKYAQKELVLSLVRLANELDNSDQDELRKLADVCLAQASKKKDLEKQAWVIPVIIGVVAVVGLLYLQQHKNFHSDGFNMDYQKTLGEIDDLLTSSVSWYGTGYQYTPEFIQSVQKLKDDLGKINEAVQKVVPLVQNVQQPRTRSEITQQLAQIAQDPKTQEADQAVKEFETVLKEYAPEVQQVVKNFSNQSYKNSVITDKGSLTKAVDWTEILHGGGGLVSDDFDDVRRALVPLWKDIVDLYNALQEAKNVQTTLKSELSSSDQIAELGKPTEEQKPAAPAGGATPNAFERAMTPLEEEFRGLSGNLGR